VKARVLPLDSAEHLSAQELLPWFVNGTLSGAEADAIARHLAHCDRCQQDAAEQAELRAVVLPDEIGRDVDRHWATLRHRINATPLGASDASRPRWQESWLWPTVAVQAAVVLALTLVLVAAPFRDERYRALGSPPPAVEPNAVAVFRSDATNQQMREALHAVDASIVAGPTVTDAYLLRLATARPEVLARLRAQPGVVSVEALQSERAR